MMKVKRRNTQVMTYSWGIVSGNMTIAIPREMDMTTTTPTVLETKFARSIAFLARKQDTFVMVFLSIPTLSSIYARPVNSNSKLD
jgi:hypothetical protein